MNSAEALEIWAKRELDKDEISYSEEDLITVVEEEFFDGYCETCYYDYTRLVIYINGVEAKRTWYDSMAEIFDELLKIASE